MERRRHRRICLSIPIKFRMQLPENQEISWVNSGNLENISPGGVDFVSNDTPPLEPGFGCCCRIRAQYSKNLQVRR